ncbi:hypothetical protein DE146DRAFT_523894 [Phaeosphaeria sp. MPI-PUGE-AT-0046c]|nr:hypothetical protein DE146DRAFT_523894 [Phaeosphaeria sp. MPI-PUGE-AT-0046c]
MDESGLDASPAGTRVNSIVLAFTVVAGLVVSLRMFARILLKRVSGFEDLWIVLAMGLSIGLAATVSSQAMNGLGKHMSELDPSKRLTLRKSFWAGLWVHSLALTTIKISILVQYLRIFPVRRFRLSCYCLLAIVAASGTWAVSSNIFTCNPVAFAWSETMLKGYCMDRKLLWYTNACLNIALDLTILLLPMPLIHRLQIPQAQKRGLVMMLAVSFTATLVSIIRLYTIAGVATTTDLSFKNPPLATLSAIEVNTGIICACLPAMRPLLALLMPKYFSNIPDYVDVVIPNDAERNGSESQKPFTVITTARANIRIHHPDLPRPTLSRTPSGRFATPPPRPHPQISPRHTPPMTRAHSRAGSNISIDIAAADVRSHARFQGRVNPLRLSPIVPFSPLNPLPGMETYSRVGSGANSPVWGWQTPRDRGGKALPLTPLPVPIEAWRVAQ